MNTPMIHCAAAIIATIPRMQKISACNGSMGLHRLDSLKLVVGMVCLDYYSAEHSWLKRINILEGSGGCERQNEGLFLEQASRVEESCSIVCGCIPCRTGKGEIWKRWNRLSGWEYYEGDRDDRCSPNYCIPRVNADSFRDKSDHLCVVEDNVSACDWANCCLAGGSAYVYKPAGTLNANILDPVTADRGCDFCRALSGSIRPSRDGVQGERSEKERTGLRYCAANSIVDTRGVSLARSQA